MPKLSRVVSNVGALCACVLVVGVAPRRLMAQDAKGTCVALSQVGWTERDKIQTASYYFSHLVREMRTEKNRDFGAATNALGKLGVPMGDFLVPFSFENSASGWAKFSESSDEYIDSRVETYSSYFRDKTTINPGVLALIGQCLQLLAPGGGTYVTLDESTDPNELALVMRYHAINRIPSVRVRFTARGLTCPVLTLVLRGGEQHAISCTRARSQTGPERSVTLNVNGGTIVTAQRWALPAKRRSVAPLPLVVDTRVVTVMGFCFNTRDNNKDDDSYSYMRVMVGKNQYAAWTQSSKGEYENDKRYCENIGATTPIPLQALLDQKIVIESGLASTNNSDTWLYSPEIGIQVTGWPTPRYYVQQSKVEVTDEHKDQQWTLPLIAVGPPPPPPPVVRAVAPAAAGRVARKGTKARRRAGRRNG